MRRPSAVQKCARGVKTPPPLLPMGTKEHQKKRESVFDGHTVRTDRFWFHVFGFQSNVCKVMHCTRIHRPGRAVPARGGGLGWGGGEPVQMTGDRLCCIFLVENIPLCSKYISGVIECVLCLTQLCVYCVISITGYQFRSQGHHQANIYKKKNLKIIVHVVQ